MEDKRLRHQAARCMDCGVPFCHTGKLISGMASGCPVNNVIPEWNDLVYRGLWREALDRLHTTNNFPEFTGRVCPAPCEGPCVLGINAPPVDDQDDRERDHRSRFGRRLGAARAAEGAHEQEGRRSSASWPCRPCGRGAAESRRVTRVTVFERADRPGGLLMYGIPNMKLDKRRSRRAPHQGDGTGRREVHLQRRTSATTSKPQLLRQRLRRDRALHGRHAAARSAGRRPLRWRACTSRWTFSPAARRRLLDGGPDNASIHARNKDVIVIGGGDTGTDCVGTAMRQGCKSPHADRDHGSSRRWIAPKTIRGRSGRRSTRWTTARKRPRRSSARIRARISRR